MGKFRDRMDDDLRIRGYSANTRECYLRCVRHFVRRFMRPPDQLTPEHIREYQLYLTRDRHVSWPYFNQVVCALRFLSQAACGRSVETGSARPPSSAPRS
jgi:integrase/recombinase XerD